jgi:signal recognition particle subunit SRP68
MLAARVAHTYRYKYNVGIGSHHGSIIHPLRQVQQYLPRHSVFLLIKSAQNAYGLKSGDYGRYRRYCGHKVIKLRHSLGIKHGSKTKFVKRDYLKERPTESKTLQVLLFNAEKNWAAANETKFSQQRKASQKSRARFVSVKKLRRALCWARQLRVICGERTDQLTQLEAQAYELWLEGTAALEEGKWAVAQGKLIACREIMSVSFI